jgi:MED6 mediator sub complex component
MFYDKQSNNQVLRMQTMHTGMPIVNEAEELKCALYQLAENLCVYVSLDDLQASSLLSCMPSHPRYLLFRNANASLQMKASILRGIELTCRTELCDSSTPCGLLHYE